MKSLTEFINEAAITPTPAVTTFYRANIGKNNNRGEQIGTVTELSYKYYSQYEKSFVYGEPAGKTWTYALGVKVTDNSTNAFKTYLALLNKENQFYQYFLKEADAIKAADKAKTTYEKKQWTLKTLLSAIKKDKDLMSLRYDYHIAKTLSTVDNTPVESIYVSGLWRITVVDGKIHIKRAGWSTYEVPNLASLYKVLAADSGSDKDETTRQQYSIVVSYS